MRKYGKTGKLETVICNMCGKKIVVKDGIVREGAAAFDHAWDYFSEKDGEVHHFDLCESCYDEPGGWVPDPGGRGGADRASLGKYAGMYRRAQVKSYFYRALSCVPAAVCDMIRRSI